jgi:hypothetical protein
MIDFGQRLNCVPLQQQQQQQQQEAFDPSII